MNILQIDNNIKLDHCPCCLASNISPVGNLKYQEKINFSSHEVILSHIPELWKCRDCLSRFVQYTVDAETAKTLYSTGRPGDRWSKDVFDQNKTGEIIEQMSTIFRGGGNVLDVGCNTGELLDFAQSFGCRTSGVEYSAASREILEEKGYKPYASLGETPGKYDVITAFDLFEHLYNVPAFLESCREKLSARGRLVILTGNIGSLSAVVAGSRWWYAQYPEHIVFPSKKFFQEKSGYRVDKWIFTYASKGYKVSLSRQCWTVTRDIILRRQEFTGLPSLGPDHVLAVLKK